MVATANAYRTEKELEKIIKAVNELGQKVARLEKRVASLEKPQTTNPKQD